MRPEPWDVLRKNLTPFRDGDVRLDNQHVLVLLLDAVAFPAGVVDEGREQPEAALVEWPNQSPGGELYSKEE